MKRTMNRREFVGYGAICAAGLIGTAQEAQAAPKKRVLVWSEGSAPKNIYPQDINAAIADGLKGLRGWEIATASLADAEQGVSEEALRKTDVLIWWGHAFHGEVRDENVARILRRVKEEGMGFIATHSGHWSKPFTRLMGTSGSWKGGYYEDGSAVKVILKDKRHPIARGLKDFVIPHTERYSEPFDVPPPDGLILDGLYVKPDGTTESSRQGMAWKVGKGRVFYFQPGHESYPIYFQEEVRRVFRNAVAWAAPDGLKG